MALEDIENALPEEVVDSVQENPDALSEDSVNFDDLKDAQELSNPNSFLPETEEIDIEETPDKIKTIKDKKIQLPSQTPTSKKSQAKVNNENRINNMVLNFSKGRPEEIDNLDIYNVTGNLEASPEEKEEAVKNPKEYVNDRFKDKSTKSREALVQNTEDSTLESIYSWGSEVLEDMVDGLILDNSHRLTTMLKKFGVDNDFIDDIHQATKLTPDDDGLVRSFFRDAPIYFLGGFAIAGTGGVAGAMGLSRLGATLTRIGTLSSRSKLIPDLMAREAIEAVTVASIDAHHNNVTYSKFSDLFTSDESFKGSLTDEQFSKLSYTERLTMRLRQESEEAIISLLTLSLGQAGVKGLSKIKNSKPLTGSSNAYSATAQSLTKKQISEQENLLTLSNIADRLNNPRTDQIVLVNPLDKSKVLRIQKADIVAKEREKLIFNRVVDAKPKSKIDITTGNTSQLKDNKVNLLTNKLLKNPTQENLNKYFKSLERLDTTYVKSKTKGGTGYSETAVRKYDESIDKLRTELNNNPNNNVVGEALDRLSESRANLGTELGVSLESMKAGKEYEEIITKFLGKKGLQADDIKGFNPLERKMFDLLNGNKIKMNPKIKGVLLEKVGDKPLFSMLTRSAYDNMLAIKAIVFALSGNTIGTTASLTSAVRQFGLKNTVNDVSKGIKTYLRPINELGDRLSLGDLAKRNFDELRGFRRMDTTRIGSRQTRPPTTIGGQIYNTLTGTSMFTLTKMDNLFSGVLENTNMRRALSWEVDNMIKANPKLTREKAMGVLRKQIENGGNSASQRVMSKVIDKKNYLTNEVMLRNRLSDIAKYEKVSPFTKGVLTGAEKLGDGIQEVPLLRDFISPFYKTAMNVFTSQAKYNPLQLINKNFRLGGYSTTSTLGQYQRQMAQAYVGLASVGVLAGLAGGVKIKLSGKEDTKLTRKGLGSVQQKFTIIIGNREVPILSLSPVGLSLVMSQMLSNITKEVMNNPQNGEAKYHQQDISNEVMQMILNDGGGYFLQAGKSAVDTLLSGVFNMFRDTDTDISDKGNTKITPNENFLRNITKYVPLFQRAKNIREEVDGYKTVPDNETDIDFTKNNDNMYRKTVELLSNYGSYLMNEITDPIYGTGQPSYNMFGEKIDTNNYYVLGGFKVVSDDNINKLEELAKIGLLHDDNIRYGSQEKPTLREGKLTPPPQRITVRMQTSAGGEFEQSQNVRLTKAEYAHYNGLIGMNEEEWDRAFKRSSGRDREDIKVIKRQIEQTLSEIGWNKGDKLLDVFVRVSKLKSHVDNPSVNNFYYMYYNNPKYSTLLEAEVLAMAKRIAIIETYKAIVTATKEVIKREEGFISRVLEMDNILIDVEERLGEGDDTSI